MMPHFFELDMQRRNGGLTITIPMVSHTHLGDPRSSFYRLVYSFWDTLRIYTRMRACPPLLRVAPCLRGVAVVLVMAGVHNL